MSDDQSSATDRFNAYTQHSAVLRTWLVAYGIGAPVLFISQDKIWSALAKSGQLAFVGKLFLTGVFIQVMLSAINKTVMWACYYGDIEPEYQNTWKYKIADWLSAQYWIDFICDILAMALFSWATLAVFNILATNVNA